MTRTWNEIKTMIKKVKQQHLSLLSPPFSHSNEAISSSSSSSLDQLFKLSDDDDNNNNEEEDLSFPDITHVSELIQSLLNDLGDSVWTYPELLCFLEDCSTSSSSVIVRYQIQMMNHQVGRYSTWILWLSSSSPSYITQHHWQQLQYIIIIIVIHYPPL